MEVADKEITETRRDRASRRRGLRKNGPIKAENGNAAKTVSCESEETFSNQVRMTRSQKSVVIVPHPLRKRAKTGGDVVSETLEKEICGNSDVFDTFVTNASKVEEFHETVVDGKDETEGNISGLQEVDSFNAEHTRSGAEVSMRTRAQRKFKGDGKIFTGSDDATRPVIELDLLAGDRSSVHEVAPLRKSCRVAMRNISNIPEYQKRGIGEVVENKLKKRLRKEYPIVIPDDEGITLAREEEMNVHQIHDKSLQSKLYASISSTVEGLEVDSGKEHQRSCENSGVDLPVIKPLRRSRRKNDGYSAFSLPDENCHEANHLNQPLKQTRKSETEYCHEAEINLIEDPGLLIKTLDSEKKHHKCRKISARVRKVDSKSVKNSPGEEYCLNKTIVSDSKDLNSDGVLGITISDKDGVCSAQHMIPSGSKLLVGSVDACVPTSEEVPLEKESTICTVEEASDSKLAKSLYVPAVKESQITACENGGVQDHTLIAGLAQRGLEVEESDNSSEFSNSSSHGLPHAGCTGDVVSIEAEQKDAISEVKHDPDNLLSTETRICNGSPFIDDEISKEDTCNKKGSNVPTKHSATDAEYKDTFSGNADQSTKARLAILNEEGILCRTSNKDKESGEQDSMVINEWQLNLYMPGPEVVKKLYGDIKLDEMVSEDHSSGNKQEEHFCIPNSYDCEEEKVVQLREPLKPQHHAEEEEDSGSGVIFKTNDSTSEAVVLSTEAGNVGSPKDSLSPVAMIDEHATNHQVPEPSQQLDEETHDSVNKVSGDAGMKLPTATKNEFCQDWHVAYIDDVCTAFHVTNSEADHSGCQAGTEIGDPASVDHDACEDYGLYSSSDKKEIIESSNAHESYNDDGMPRESTSYAEFPFDGLLQEIDDYLKWTKSKEKVVLEKSALGDDNKEKVLNSNKETCFEVPIRTCYGTNVHTNECKYTAGIDVEVYASPLEGHGEQINENADYKHVGDILNKDDQVDLHEDISEQRCSRLSGFGSDQKSFKSPNVVQTSPNESAICTAETTVDIGTHETMTGMQDGTSFATVSPLFSADVVTAHNSQNELAGYAKNNNKEATPLATNDILEPNTNNSWNMTGVTATARKQIAKVMKENFTPFSKTESLKRPKPVSNRRRVLNNLQNN